MKIGYARVSTQDQNLDLQIDALNEFGCKKIFTDKASGAKTARPELDKMLEQLREGDVVVIWKLDRLGRNLKHLVELVAQFNEQKVGLVSLNDPVDTTTAQGRLVFNIFASLAEFERDIISERTKAGLAAARKRGRKGGRPKGLSEEAQQKAMIAETLYKEEKLTVNQICERLGIARATLYSYLRHRGWKQETQFAENK
jgi:DNA invertase Pin-like site-specific DNA recombinase